MTRRLTLLVLVAFLATAGTGALLVARERARIEPATTAPAPSGLALIVVATEHGPLPAVVGTTGFGTTGALVISPGTLLVVPGQGESTVGDALELPPRQAATAVGNLLGVWIEDHATIDTGRLEAIADETDGIEQRWHDASETEGAETWATVVTEATDIEVGSAVVGDANVWGFCSLPIR